MANRRQGDIGRAFGNGRIQVRLGQCHNEISHENPNRSRDVLGRRLGALCGPCLWVARVHAVSVGVFRNPNSLYECSLRAMNALPG